MPKIMNPHENGLHRSLRLYQQQEMEESNKFKSFVTFGTAADTNVAFGLFSLIALASNFTIPEHQTNPNSTYAEQFMNRFREVNELYDGTLNEIHNFMYATNIDINECFTFINVMNQDNKISFVDAMEKEISDHEAGGHWSVFCSGILTNKERPFKAIWSFKSKRKPYGELLKRKARLCAHGGM